jgi:phosphoribosylanthranilate isomerase
MVWIKICGITDKDDALEIARLGADSIGFVFFNKSPRYIETGKAAEIISHVKSKNLAKKPAFTGVFVNEDTNYVIEISKYLGLDYIQLSGNEDIGYVNTIKKTVKSASIIKLIRISKDATAQNLQQQMKVFKEFTDLFLVDTMVNNLYGGTGETFNWDIAKEISRIYPVILAGGLDSINVMRAIETVGPFGVDASSRLETCPGRKDINKVRLFINKIKEKGTVPARKRF